MTAPAYKVHVKRDGKIYGMTVIDTLAEKPEGFKRSIRNVFPGADEIRAKRIRPWTKK